MKIEKILDLHKIATINPITNKKINNGYRKEICYKAFKTGYIDYKLDNTAYDKDGDLNKKSYIYQVKGCKAEIKLLKQYNNVKGFENVLNQYIETNKANRYVYIIEKENDTLAITMDKKEFKNFVKELGTYSETRNNIRLYKNDNIVYKWATANA